MTKAQFMTLMARGANDFWNQELQFEAELLEDGEKCKPMGQRSQADLCCTFADFLKAYHEQAFEAECKAAASANARLANPYR